MNLYFMRDYKHYLIEFAHHMLPCNLFDFFLFVARFHHPFQYWHVKAPLICTQSAEL